MYLIKGIVYKIEFAGHLYIGSTIKSLFKRETEHNWKFKKMYNYKLYKVARKCNIEKLKCVKIFDEYIIDPIQIKCLEQQYIEELKPDLNTYRAITPTYEAVTKKRKKYKSTKIHCEYCDRKITRSNMAYHKRKHCKVFKTLTEEEIKSIKPRDVIIYKRMTAATASKAKNP